MPPVVAAIVVGAAGVGVGAISLTSLVTTIALGFASTALQSAFAEEPQAPPFLGSRGRTVTVRSPNEPRQIIYGTSRAGGVIIFLEETEGTKYIHIVQILAGHPVSAIPTVYFDGVEVPLDGSGNAVGTYAGKARVKKLLGAVDQPADPDLLSECPSWTASHRLRGLAGLYTRLEWDSELFPNGIPTITADVDGRMVWDPRDGGQSATDPSTWTHSRNSVLCRLDYLRGVPMLDAAGTLRRPFGAGIPDADFNLTVINSEANIADESVAKNGGGSAPRYTMDGIVSSAAPIFQTLKAMNSADGGVVFRQGWTWNMRVGAARTAETSVITDATLRSKTIRVQRRRTRAKLFNHVRGQYIGESTNWVPKDFPVVTDATYVSEDNGQDLYADREYPFTDNPSTGQRLARLELALNRQQTQAWLACNLSAMKYSVGDWVKVTNTTRGWDEKLFLVTDWALVQTTDSEGVPMLGVDLSLQEIATSVYAWANDEEIVAPTSDTTLSNPLVIPPPSALSVNLGQWTSEGNVTLSATPATSGPPVRYEFDYRRVGTSAYTPIAINHEPEALVNIVDTGIYEFRVRALELNGPAKSIYVTDSKDTTPTDDIPRVRGLELTNGNSSNEFFESDASFAWRDTRVQNPDDAGLELDDNVDGTKRDANFREYYIRVLTPDGQRLREDSVQQPKYTYSLSDNLRDSRILNRSGPVRDFIVEVTHRTQYQEGRPTKIRVSNPAPAKLLTVNYNTTPGALAFHFDHTKREADHEGWIVKVSTIQGFDPETEGTTIFEGNADGFVALAGPATYYARAAAFDPYGKKDLNYADEQEVVLVGAVDPATISAIEGDIVTIQGNQTTYGNQWTVSTSADTALGQVVTGMTLVSGADNVSRFSVLANTFSISSVVDGAFITPFVVDGGAVYMDEAYIRNLNGSNINVTTLSALVAELGSVSTGRIQSPSGNLDIRADATASYFRITT